MFQPNEVAVEAPAGITLTWSAKPKRLNSAMPEIRLFRLEGGQRFDPAVEAWLHADQTASRQLARTWFTVIQSLGPDVLALLHDGHPTACVGDLAFAYVNAFTAHANVGFYFGSVLPDPARLLQGRGRFMRHVQVTATPAPLDAPLLTLLRVAYADVRARQG